MIALPADDGQAVTRARSSWGKDVPPWVLALARACDAGSGASVAKRLGYSGAVVSQVLRNAYQGSLSRVEEVVRGAFMAETVGCPVVGEIAKDLCAEHQRRPFANTNPTRVRLYRACRGGCPHSKVGGAA